MWHNKIDHILQAGDIPYGMFWEKIPDRPAVDFIISFDAQSGAFIAWVQDPNYKQNQATLYAGSVDQVQFQLLFNHENRIRALELKPAITAAQFKQALINQWLANNP